MPDEHRALAAQVRIIPGMHRDAVFFSSGLPHRISEGVEQGRSFERWNCFAYTPVHAHG